jgi:endonuclease YncB( thermonuclease family)
VIVAGGDVACDPGNSSFNGGDGTTSPPPGACHQKYTSDLIASVAPTHVLALGDLQYEDGALAKFQASYDLASSWGRVGVKEITKPVPGNHEYGAGNTNNGNIHHDANATGYFTYFAGQLSPLGADAVNPQKGWYSYDVGSWHVIAINSECAAGLATQVGWSGGCAAGSPQEEWLRQDLAAHDNTCTLAYWHHPRFSSAAPTLNDNPIMAPIWKALYDNYADVVLNGHAHHYERFAPQDPAGAPAPGRGVREWIVGTGGRSFTMLDDAPEPATQVRQASAYGVLELTLHDGSYEWEFLNDGQSGDGFTDSGSADCVEPPAPKTTPPPAKPTPPPTPAPAPVAKKHRIAARVTRVVDGDTIKARALTGRRRRYTVRLLGIDAPQRRPAECAAITATRRLKRLTFVGGRGRRVTLITDPTQPLRDRRGRLLAYVKRRDGKNLAGSQLRGGWARVLGARPRFQLFDRFRATQRRARRARRGAWRLCHGNFHRRVR